MNENEIEFSEDQVKGIKTTSEWLDSLSYYSTEESRDLMIFRVFGYAGTGKTTIIKHLIEEYQLFTSFAAFTGKAAMVMRQHDLPAQTIHSLIYKPIPPNKKKCDELLTQAKACKDKKEKTRLYLELNEARKVEFALLDLKDSDLAGSELLVLDECSMVNEDMLKDLLSFNVPMLVLGDPGQLPPINGVGALVGNKPNVLLTQIHRQAADNPIIDFATRARNQLTIPYTDQSAARKITKANLTNADALAAE